MPNNIQTYNDYHTEQDHHEMDEKNILIDTYIFYNYNRIDFPPYSITFSIIYDLFEKRKKKKITIFEILKSVCFFLLFL